MNNLSELRQQGSSWSAYTSRIPTIHVLLCGLDFSNTTAFPSAQFTWNISKRCQFLFERQMAMIDTNKLNTKAIGGNIKLEFCQPFLNCLTLSIGDFQRESSSRERERQ